MGTKGKFKILSFCGGGIRGYLSVLMLRKLNDLIGTDIMASADMYAGTSTGAIISALIPTLPSDNKNIKYDLLEAFYSDIMLHIFKDLGRKNPDEPELSMTEVQKSILDFLKKHDIPLGALEKTLNQIDKKLLMTSFYVDSVKQYQPGSGNDKAINDSWGMLLLNNFPSSKNGETRLFDAAFASGAMPGMSSPVELSLNNTLTLKSESLHCVDGAFVNHDPTLAAISLAIQNGYALEDISVITLGTGFMRNYLVNDYKSDAPEKPNFMDWGSDQWVNLPEGNLSKVPSLWVNYPPKSPVMNMMLNGTSTNEIPALSEMMLNDRYAYLNADFGDKVVPEDATDEMDFMKEAADTVDVEYAKRVFDHNWLD